MNRLINLDLKLFQFLNQELSNPFFDAIMPIITNQDYWIIPVLAAAGYILWADRPKGKWVVLVLILTVVITDIFCYQVIKPMVGRLRPSHSGLEQLNLLVGAGGKFGFVSNHAANSFTSAVIIGKIYRPVLYPLLILASVIAFSRVYVGVHYPGDVLFGALVGSGIAMLILFLVSKTSIGKRLNFTPEEK